MANDIKVKMFGKHFCQINRDLMIAFENKCRIINFSAWIREQVYIDFKYTLSSEEDLSGFVDLVKFNYYPTVGEWVREKMRTRLKGV